MRKGIITVLILSFLAIGCTPKYEGTQTDETADIFPDYTEVVIPSNIAPLNFNINNEGSSFVTMISGEKSGELTVKGQKVRIPLKGWKSLIEANIGADLLFVIDVKREGKWIRLSQFKCHVAEEPIDEYLVYRLLAPSYEFYTAFSIRQRDITTGKDREVYNNRMHYNPKEQQCMNCHQFQNYRTENWQMHVRQVLGGTVIITGDESRKVNLKTDSTISAGVYPAWHPKEKLIAYSVNKTRQFFHVKNIHKLEVQDPASDLILYDIDRNEVSKIADDPMAFETFPTWSPDGKYLYYSSARQPEIATLPSDSIAICFDMIYYDIVRRSFEPETKTFGDEEVVFDAKSLNLSAMEPRISPDGRYLLFSLGEYGTFHIWHRGSDIWVMDLATGETWPLEDANSDDADSFHNWSSNGRWVVFTSRRDDGLFSRVYFSYFDTQGKAHKAFMLPSENPSGKGDNVYSYNVPEFTIEPVRQSVRDLSKIISRPVGRADFAGE